MAVEDQMCHKVIEVLDIPGLPEPHGQVHITRGKICPHVCALFLEVVVSLKLKVVMFQAELGGS